METFSASVMWNSVFRRQEYRVSWVQVGRESFCFLIFFNYSTKFLWLIVEPEFYCFLLHMEVKLWKLLHCVALSYTSSPELHLNRECGSGAAYGSYRLFLLPFSPSNSLSLPKYDFCKNLKKGRDDWPFPETPRRRNLNKLQGSLLCFTEKTINSLKNWKSASGHVCSLSLQMWYILRSDVYCKLLFKHSLLRKRMVLNKQTHTMRWVDSVKRKTQFLVFRTLARLLKW